MKINRRQFLKALPAAALALTACGSGQQEAPATTDALVLDHAYPLDYARQFTADVYTDGSVLLTIAESGERRSFPSSRREPWSCASRWKIFTSCPAP